MKTMLVSVVIADFIRQMRASGYARATIDSYSKGLTAFGRYLQGHGINSIRKVTRETIAAYRSSVMAMSLAPESKALKLRPVKRLFEHLVRMNRLLLNPAENLVETTRKYRKIGPVLSKGQIKQLIQVPDMTTPVGVRNRAIMAVLYATGIRLRELLGLQTTDIDFTEGLLFVRRGKGTTQRVVPLGTDAADILSTYLDKVRPVLGANAVATNALFLTAKGTPMTAGALRIFLQIYRSQAGIDTPVSPHVFRRSCATHFLQSGADIRYVQQLLGHSSLKVTHYYTKVLPVDLKKTHDATHPGINDAPD